MFSQLLSRKMNRIEEFKKINSKIETVDGFDPRAEVLSLRRDIIDTILILEEGIMLTDQVAYKREYRSISRFFTDHIRNIDRYLKTNDLSIVKSICKDIEEIEYFINTQVLRNFRNYYVESYIYEIFNPNLIRNENEKHIRKSIDINQKDAENILSSIDFGNIKRNALFMTPCGNSVVKDALLDNYNNVETFAIEEREDLYLDSKGEYDNLIYGSGTGSIISNNAFDFTYAVLPINNRDFNTAMTKRYEVKMFRDMCKYTRTGGIIMFALPINRLTQDFALEISKSLENVKIYKEDKNYREKSYTDSSYGYGVEKYEFFATRKVIVLGNLKEKKDIDKETYKKLFNLTLGYIFDYPESKFYFDESKKGQKDIQALSSYTKVGIFNGSNVSYNEIENVIKDDDIFFKEVEQINRDMNSRKIEPLLPFSLGQIGLVLTSGRLDGAFYSQNGEDAHVIRGQVEKYSTVRSTRLPNGESTVAVVTQNRVKISLVDSSGEFKELV